LEKRDFLSKIVYLTLNQHLKNSKFLSYDKKIIMFHVLFTEHQRVIFDPYLVTHHPMKFHLRFWPLAVLIVMFSSCLKQEDPIETLPMTQSPVLCANDVTWAWMEEYLSIEKNLPNFRPAPTCRALAYIHMGAYETGVPGMEHYRSLSGVIAGFPEINLKYRVDQTNWNIALNAYYARVFKFFLFGATPHDINTIETLEADKLTELSSGVPQGIVNTSIEWGQQVANAIIAYSETDREGADQVRIARPADYFPPIGDGLWIPTSPDYGSALFPYWGRVRTFAATQNDLISLPPSAPFSTDPNSAYYQQNLEVEETVNNMTQENHWIAEFWSDDLTGMTFSPPARIFAIANQVVSIEKMNLEETLHLYCVMGMAINDASVACWNSKYIYNTERPVTYIRKYINPDFQPILGEAIHNPGLTPAFPGYPSGHSTFAGVGLRILDHFFGDQYTFTDQCHYGRLEFSGYPRTYTSWTQMAEEDAFSRIPLGVHIRQDCSEGLRLGNVIAQRALGLDLSKG
jgi:hypothetical protein